MNTGRLIFAALLLCATSTSAVMAKPKFIEFDAPGAGTDEGEGTEVLATNALGDVTGNYLDQGADPHGFLRLYDGTFVSYNSPFYVLPNAINGSASTTGEFYDTQSRGFI